MEYTKLGHIAKIQTGPFGSQLHQSDYKPSGIPCIMPCNIGSNLDIICDNIAYISEEDLNRLAKHKTQEGDIVYSRRGDIEKCAYISSKESGWLCGTGCLKVSIDNTVAIPKFIAYLLSTPDSKAWLVGNAVGTTMLNLNTTVLSDFPISLPDIETQQKVVDIIDAVADKIELNKRINDNLEQQLKLLYRSWFIENKHPDSKEVCLSEIIYFQEGPGIRNWQYVEKDGIKFINIRCIEGGDINLTTANMISEEEANGKYAHFMLKPFDIIMSCSGTLGRYAIVRKEHLPLCLNTSVIRFSPNRSESDYSYIYGYLASEEFLNKQVEMACGSVQANFGPTHLKQIKIIAPPIDYCKSYHTAAMPIISKILENRREIQHLGKLRDTLLPKLMSGELKINEIDC